MFLLRMEKEARNLTLIHGIRWAESWQQRIAAGYGTVVSVATLPCCHKVMWMTFHTSPPINYIYCTVARSILTVVATTAIVEWETRNSGDTPVAYCTEAVCS